MLKTILIFSIFLLGSSIINKSTNDFEAQLNLIVRDFKMGIMDIDECENQKRNAGDLSDEIENAIKMNEEYTIDEINNFIKLKSEAEALEEYIASVGGCGNYIPSIDNIKLANSRVGGSIANVSNGTFCVDIICVTIGNYISYLGENNSSKNYTVTYKWKTLNGMNTGKGTMGLSKLSVRHIYDNRENPSQKNISFYGITCVEF
jgi:hypothetical protein